MLPEFDLITMGRVSVDLYPEQVGVPLIEVASFSKSLGGSAANVAVAAARLGTRSTVITKVGDDPFGTYVHEALQEFGVDPRFVFTDPDLRTPLAFCEIRPPDHFPILFYREPKAPDMALSRAELPLNEISEVELFWTTGTATVACAIRATLGCARTSRRARSSGSARGKLWMGKLTYRWPRA